MPLLTEREWNARAKELQHKLKEAWAAHCEKDGSNLLFSKNLLALLRLVPFFSAGRFSHAKPSGLDADFALARMGLSKYHIHDGVYLRYSTVERWYLQEMLGERGDARNTLLIRGQIGLKKTGYHRMPPVTESYGGPPSAQGGTGDTAWDLLHNKFSKVAEQGVGANKRTLFPLDAAHPEPNFHKPRPSSAQFNPEARFGTSTLQREKGDRVPASDLINYKFGVEGKKGMEMAPDLPYAPNQNKRLPGRLPPPRPTSASIARADTVRAQYMGRPDSTGLDVMGHALLHAQHVHRPERTRPMTARM